MAPPRKKRARPHERAKAEADARAAAPIDDDWANRIIEALIADEHPWQRDAREDPSVRISMLWGRGCGKTTLFRVRALIKMVTRRNALIAYIATSRPTARRLNWNPLKALIDQLGVTDDFDFHESRGEVTCKRTGSTYFFIGADDTSEVEKLRGQPWDEVQVDESASHDEELLEYMLMECVAPRLGERRGVILLAGTPGRVLRGRFFDVTFPGSKLHRDYRDRDKYDRWIGWSSHSVELLDIVNLPDADRYPAMLANWEAALEEKEREQWGDDNPKWMREYRRRWARNDTTMMYQYIALDSTTGEIINRWDPLDGKKLEGVAALKAAIAKLPDEFNDYAFGYGLDLGARDPFALVIRAMSPSDVLRRMWHVFSFERPKMYARLIAELLIGEHCVKKAMRNEVYLPSELGGCFGVTGWPIAIVADLAGLGEVIIEDLAKVYGIKIKAADKKDKPGAIEEVNGSFVDRRYWVMKDSLLETQYSTLQWKPDDFGNNKEDKSAANHSADADTYISKEMAAKFAGASSKKQPPKTDPAKPAKSAATKAAPEKSDAWGDAPTRTKKRSAGEFGALGNSGDFDQLLTDGDYTGMDWGNG